MPDLGRAFVALLILVLAAAAPAQEPILEPPAVVLSDVPFDLPVVLPPSAAGRPVVVRIGEERFAVEPDIEGRLAAIGVRAPRSGSIPVTLEVDGTVVAETAVRSLPGWVSVLPPLLAILAALLTRNVIPALFLGVWSGAFAVRGFSLEGAFLGLLDAFQVYVLEALADADHASIILFTLMIGGMVGIVSRNGGMQGVVNLIAPLASTPRRGQAATGLLGLAVFFDDYANVLVVGGTMRKITDALRISREKLAYIVDSTAAPVSCVAFVTTWIGFEVGLIGEAVDRIEGLTENAYSIFLGSIAYSFYPWLAMMFVFVVALSGRDFGPMLHAERRARHHDEVLPPDAQVDAAGEAEELKPKAGKPHRALNAVLPVLVLVGGVLGGLYATGEGETIRDIIGSADSYKALMWASLLGVVVAVVLSLGQGILTLRETVDAWYAGMRAMLLAMVILVLAWSLSGLTETLQTAPYLVTILGETLLPALIPAIIFVLAAAVAFATGTSWGTMGILMPLVIPLVWAVLARDGDPDPARWHLMYSSVACTLGGAVWGDHCSPISDTTVLSSLASGCDHIDHVRTQLPYALVVGAVAVLLGTVPTGFGLPWWLCMGVAGGTLIVVHRVVGKRVTD